MANISNVINVSLLPEGRLAARDNLNITAILTQSQAVLGTNERYRIYRDAQGVANDFGSTSAVSQYANTFFGTQPNPSNAGGYLVIGYWRGSEETTTASAAELKSATLNTTGLVNELRQISDGEFDIDVDGTTVSATALDFQSIVDFDDAVDVLDTAITGATVTSDPLGIVITSDTTGATSTLTYATDPEAGGTYLGELLGIASGTGAVLTQGADSEVLAAETQVEALTALRNEVKYYGAMFIDPILDVPTIAAWAQANSTLVYEVFSADSNLEVDPANPVWAVTLAGQDRFRMLYRADGNRKFAASYMARVHTVNFNAENSALTMNLKTVSVPAEELSETVITKAKTVGLDVYTTVKLTPVVLTSGANNFADNVYNLIGYVDALQTDLFNLLKATSTKIPQTTSGVQQLVAECEKTSRNFVRAGVFAPGEWSSPDSFGDIDVFKRSIRERGFYFLAGQLSDQPQSDRQARKSPVIQGAVKNAGAIHSADIIVNFNL
jgi:hypothetical protein